MRELTDTSADTAAAKRRQASRHLPTAAPRWRLTAASAVSRGSLRREGVVRSVFS